MSSRGLLGSIAVIGGAQAVIIAISLVRVKVLAVLLGPVGVGLLGAFNNLQQTAMLVTGLGMMTSGTREVARKRENPPELTAIRCALVAGLWAQGAVAVAVVWIFREPLSVLLLGDPAYAFQTGLVGVAALIGLLSQSQLIQLQGMNEVPRLAQATVAGALAGTALGLIAVLASGRDGVIWFVIVQPLATAAVAYAHMPRLPRLGRSLLAGKAVWRVWRRMVGLGVLLMLGGLSITVAVLLVRGIVAQELGLEAAGHFSAAWSLTLLSVGFLLNAMSVDYFPRLSAVIDDRTAASALMNDQMQTGLAIGGPILLLLIGLAPLAVRLLYAADFAPAVPVLQWQCLGNLFKLACWPATFVLAAAGRSGLFFIAQACFGSVFVLLVWLAMPRVGLDICGIAFAAGYVVQFGLAMIVLHRMKAVVWESRSLRVFAGFAGAGCVELAISLFSPVWGAAFGIVLSVMTGFFSVHLLVGKTGAAAGILRQVARLYAALGWPVEARE